MKIYGIVAEYNPFHNGHKFQIDDIRKKAGDCAIVSVMSGNYVQRAETAVMSKYARAKAALLGGVDLVLELPMPYAISSAERFAYSSVHILNSLGAVTDISFGSECGSISLLQKAVEALYDENVNLKLKAELKKRCKLSGGEVFRGKRCVRSGNSCSSFGTQQHFGGRVYKSA